MRTVINAAIIQDKKILLVKKKETWILPGGKPKLGESDLECLCREVHEELSGTELQNFMYYGKFKGKSPHTGDIVHVKVYLADIKGEIYGASAEIVASEWAKEP